MVKSIGVNDVVRLFCEFGNIIAWDNAAGA